MRDLMSKIPRSFFQTDNCVALTRALIGKYLFTCLGPENVITGGMITEAEAYCGSSDRASHAYNNRRTKRTETMFSEGGVAYIYLCYGIHYLFNIVTGKKDMPHGILIRAIRPEVGVDVMLRRRGKKKVTDTLTRGPGSVSQALGITTKYLGVPVDGDKIWIEDRGVIVPKRHIKTSPRIGIDYAGEDASHHWRFFLDA